MRLLILIACVCLTAGCTVGSSTSRRPALTRPAVGPEGTFWDAAGAAQRDNAEAFLFLVSTRWLHEQVLPRRARFAVTTGDEYAREDLRLRKELEPYAVDKVKLARRYMAHLRETLAGRFLDVGKPEYELLYKDEFGRAVGPNHATVAVLVHPKGPAGNAAPASVEVHFVQHEGRWLLDGLTPDPNKGAFARE